MAANFAMVVGVRGDTADVLMPLTLEGHTEAKAVYDSVLDAKGVVGAKAVKAVTAVASVKAVKAIEATETQEAVAAVKAVKAIKAVAAVASFKDAPVTKDQTIKYDYVELIDTRRGLLRKRSC